MSVLISASLGPDEAAAGLGPALALAGGPLVEVAVGLLLLPVSFGFSDPEDLVGGTACAGVAEDPEAEGPPRIPSSSSPASPVASHRALAGS